MKLKGIPVLFIPGSGGSYKQGRSDDDDDDDDDEDDDDVVAFQFAASTVWNSIPHNIRLLPSIGSFKSSLKTHLFSLPG